jgi:hypothetical protein
LFIIEKVNGAYRVPLNNKLKIAHAISSWQPIESYFKNIFWESTRLKSKLQKKHLVSQYSKEKQNIYKRKQTFF